MFHLRILIKTTISSKVKEAKYHADKSREKNKNIMDAIMSLYISNFNKQLRKEMRKYFTSIWIKIKLWANKTKLN